MAVEIVPSARLSTGRSESNVLRQEIEEIRLENQKSWAEVEELRQSSERAGAQQEQLEAAALQQEIATIRRQLTAETLGGTPQLTSQCSSSSVVSDRI
jgi:septation ring formation regulator EzrA